VMPGASPRRSGFWRFSRSPRTWTSCSVRSNACVRGDRSGLFVGETGGGRGWTMRGSGRDAGASQTTRQRPAADAEDIGGELAGPVSLLQHALDVPLLHFAEGREPGRGARLVRRRETEEVVVEVVVHHVVLRPPGAPVASGGRVGRDAVRVPRRSVRIRGRVGRRRWVTVT